MKKTIITIMLALVWVTGWAQKYTIKADITPMIEEMAKYNVVIDTFTFGKGDDFGARSEVGVFFELISDGLISFASIIVININEMEKYRCTVNMTQEIVTEAFAFGSPLNKTWNIGDE